MIASSGEDVDSLARQAEVIQRTLAQEIRPAESGPVVESVRLTELVDRSVEMVPPALRACLAVELDPSVAQTAALRLPRITLQQVFQT